MWNWIAKLLKSSQDNSAGASGEILVNEEDYEFKVGTNPTLPKGLRDLKITELRPGLLLLEHFDADLNPRSQNNIKYRCFLQCLARHALAAKG